MEEKLSRLEAPNDRETELFEIKSDLQDEIRQLWRCHGRLDELVQRMYFYIDSFNIDPALENLLGKTLHIRNQLEGLVNTYNKPMKAILDAKVSQK